MLISIETNITCEFPGEGATKIGISFYKMYAPYSPTVETFLSVKIDIDAAKDAERKPK